MHFFRIFLHHLDISPKLLWESTSYFGDNPRLCFRAARSVKEFEATKNDARSEITAAAEEKGNLLQLLHASRRGGSAVSHTIFVISPTNEERRLTQCAFGAVSRWAFDLLLEHYETQQADAAATFYVTISRISEAASLWGDVFEKLVLNHLDGIRGEEFSIRGLTSTEPMTWTYRGPPQRLNFQWDSEFIDEITKAVEGETPLHLVPLSRNFAAVDSIMYDPNEALTCIRVTVGKEHDILVSGLQRIQSWLKQGTKLEGLRPSEKRPWRFIFVVPSGMESFELQQLKGDTAKGEWAGKVHQYVSVLDAVGKRITNVVQANS